jgi:tetraacyldisaccharide 4'-kinase
LALALGARLIERGVAAHFLSRGYGGRAPGPLRVDAAIYDHHAVGDEPLLLALVAPTWIARDRAAGAEAAAAAGAQAIIMDDGLHNRRLRPDLSVIAIDGAYGFGNGLTLPAGPLREGLANGIARARAAILIGEDRTGIEARLAGILPIIAARLQPRAPETWRGRRVYAFAGIGRPAKFFETLSALGADVTGAIGFADHHAYSAAELARLSAAAAANRAILVTTAKDHVRLPMAARAAVAVLHIDLVWRDADAADKIDALILPLL